MKRILISAMVVITLVGAAGYFLYRSYMTEVIANALVADKLPSYIPKGLQKRVEKIRGPLNKGTEAMVQKMRTSDIPLEQLMRAVDNTTEKDAYAFLEEVNKRKPANTNEVFDIAKKHFRTDFDVEVFREPFNNHFRMKQIENAIAYANMSRNSGQVDISTAKELFKKIIVEKDKQMAHR